MLTEPYVYQGKIVGLPSGYDAILKGEDGTPRAAILVPKKYKAICLSHLCAPDCTVIQIPTAQGKLVIASVYMDIRHDIPPDILYQLLEYVDGHNYGLIIGADSNAHSTLFGPDMNKRGELLEEFIIEQGLLVENQGNLPTFATWRGDTFCESHIDVTLSKGEVVVQDWEVHTEYNGSDHNTITWRLDANPERADLIRPWAKANWDAFKNRLNKANIFIPHDITKESLDEMVTHLYGIINEALDAACPLREKNTKCRANRWYSTQLADLAKRVKKQYLRSTRTKSNLERLRYKSLQKKYSKQCAKAKLLAWRSYVDATPNESKMAILDKILQRRARQSIYTLRKPDGSYTKPGKETIDLLIATHLSLIHI